MAKAAIRVYLKSAIESGFNFIRRRFESLGELNDNFHAQREWIISKLDRKADYKRRLAKVLEVLKMHSCKYIGISFLTENRLCEAYEAQHGEPISKRTVGACVKQLREMGFITAIPAKREDGKQTANIIVIERFDTGVSDGGGERPGKLAHKEPENLRTKKTTSPSKTTAKEVRERMAKGLRLLNFVPRWFKERIGCCSREARDVHEFWKVAKHLAKRTFGAIMGADEWQRIVSSAVRDFYLSAKAAARGKFSMHNKAGFFHAVLEAEAYAYVRRRAHEGSPVLYDWLAE